MLDITKIQNAVIPAAGLGTRLLPTTKETPKEMLPIFAINKKGEVLLKPVLQVVFEQFFDFGIRTFCFIVNREKNSIKKHFTFNGDYLTLLKKKGKMKVAEELQELYYKVHSSSLKFVHQSEPRGFGDAVLRAQASVWEPFLVQAGDTHITSTGNHHLTTLLTTFEEYECAATFLVQEVKYANNFGIMEGEEIEKNIYHVERVIEKPPIPSTNYAITGLYIFTPEIFEALKSLSNHGTGELQLTDGIQRLIDWGLTVIAVKLDSNGFWFDVGNPLSYWKALNLSHQLISKY